MQAPVEYQERFAHITEDHRRTYVAMVAFLDDQSIWNPHVRNCRIPYKMLRFLIYGSDSLLMKLWSVIKFGRSTGEPSDANSDSD